MSDPQSREKALQLAFKSGLIFVFILTLVLIFLTILTGTFQDNLEQKKTNSSKPGTGLADCLPLVVTSPADDLATCGTLRYALNYIATNPNLSDKTVDLSSLSQGTILQVSGSSLVVPIGANLQAPCASGLILDGTALNGDGIILSGQNNISGLKIGGFGQRQVSFNYPDPNAARTVSFSCTQLKAGGAAEIVPIQGLTQSTTVATAFPTSLQVKFQRWYGEALPGITVTFSLSAGTNGASASFAGGLSSVDSVTDNGGIATAPTLNANTIAGDFTVQITATLPGSTPTLRSYRLTNLAGSPTSLAISGGQGQSVTVNTYFPQPLQVTLTDSFGNLVPGIGVTFTAPGVGQPGGSFANGQNQLTSNTSSAGVVSASLKANIIAGNFNLTASYNGLSTTFNLSNLAGPPASLTAQAGSGQSALIGTAFPLPFQARVSDAYGNPTAGVTVNFSAPGSGASGSFNGGSNGVPASSNSSGLVSTPTFTANSIKGNYLVTATTAGVVATATFSLTNLGPTAITVVAGSGQSTNIGTTFPTTMQAKVTDQNGNPLSGILVTFSAPGSGASGSFSGSANTINANTDFNGIATAPTFSANLVAGSYKVSASTAGVAPSALFSLSNLLGPTIASASVSNPNPPRNSTVTVYGQLTVNGLPAVGAVMNTTWHYKTTTSSCSGTTDSNGQASCSRGIGNATLGYRVVINVVFTYNGQNYSTSTSFTPQ